MSTRIINADCRDAMREMDAESIDAIVTDPPYHLTTGKKGGSGPASVNVESPYGRARVTTGFMGKAWDGGDIAHDPTLWAEALRVAKPGAHLLAFGGTRTFHRLACAIEDAGWEIRDCVMWVYGSGFPKSLDVSKAIDKRGGNSHLTREVGEAIKAARMSRGISAAEADARYCGGSTLWTWYEGRPAGQQMPTAAIMARIAADWPELDRLARLIAEAERETIATADGSRLAVAPGQGNDRSATIVDITAPATDAARAWAGWGTALKPAWEPIIVARKPLRGTVAANVQEFGTGALNIDGCRIVIDDGERETIDNRSGADDGIRNGIYCDGVGARGAGERFTSHTLGRWPANVIHDGSDEVVALFPESDGKAAAVGPQYGAKDSVNAYGDFGPRDHFAPRGDTGSAARFFYTAKASRSDREDGLAHRPKNPLLWSSGEQSPGTFQSPNTERASRNHHPTVKPTDLMQYLCRLVTPPGGTVLDPFCGSGSTGRAALLEGFNFIGIELDAEYAAIARDRIYAAAPLFAGAAD